MPPRTHEYEHVEVADRAAWRRWLRANHTRSPGAWLVYYKKATGLPTVPYADAVEEALCFGWIDSTVRSLDERRHAQLFTPRKPRSPWSATNKRRVEALIASKKMTKAGLAAIEAAKANGMWSAADDSEALVVPADLHAALTAAGARATWDGFSPSSRKGILYWISTAKRTETRERRIAETARMAAKGLRVRFDPE